MSRHAGNGRIYPPDEVAARAHAHAHAPALTHTCPRVLAHGVHEPLRVRMKTRHAKSRIKWQDGQIRLLFMALFCFCAGNSS